MVGRQFQLSHALAAAFCLPCSLSLLFAARQTILLSLTQSTSQGRAKTYQILLTAKLDSAYGFIQFWLSLEFFHPIISKLDSMSTVLLPVPGAHNLELATPTPGLMSRRFLQTSQGF